MVRWSDSGPVHLASKLPQLLVSFCDQFVSAFFQNRLSLISFSLLLYNEIRIAAINRS